MDQGTAHPRKFQDKGLSVSTTLPYNVSFRYGCSGVPIFGNSP